ncbi:DoxX family protein [Jannaschia sp. Os4]|uniref:DoxX family protein n=1 Tax=Jannaschia sp. Os4 TaxID=2807617 RepID=UPI00193A79FE|nr:DoxX family protein [Jannaschia sp. Os4]MBM2576381.1 DoxX family protein [Jannaschia sp. Os4]
MTTFEPAARPATSKWQNLTLWAFQVLAALAFLAAGGSKLIGAESMVALFDQIGMGQWFRYLTGLLEVGGAILLLIPATAWIGGALLATVMVGAIYTHVALIGGSFVPALVLLLVTGTVWWARRPRGPSA